MFYIKKIVISSLNKSGVKVVSSIDLKAGLNIIHGPSNTGKTLILDCIDFMLGGEAKRLYKKELGIRSISMLLDASGAEINMTRELGTNEVTVLSGYASVESGTYTTGNRTKEKEALNTLWLRLMGIDSDVKIIAQIQDAVQHQLTVRTFYHAFIISEGRIIGENSILKSGQGFSNNIPVPTIMSLIYLATGENYINPNEKKKETGKTISVKRSTAKAIVDRSVVALGELDKQDDENTEHRSVAEIQAEIDALLIEISDAEDALKVTDERHARLSDELIRLSDSLSESILLKERYDSLRTQYEADIRRLTFIAEADMHKDRIPMLERCPFCNGELPKEKSQSCLEAAIAEAERIRSRICDLQSAAEAITHEIDAMKIRRSALVAEQQRVQSVIRGKLRPQIAALRRQLTEYTIALEKAKADEMVESFVEILNNELTAIYKEDDVSEYRFDVREKIVNVLQQPLEKHLTEILQLCHYDNYRGSRFDVDSCDVVVNGSDKLSQGKGFRAFLNSVMALAVQEMLSDYDLHKTNLLVMDSPILSLKEKEENVGTQVTSDSMRSGLFQYMIDRQEMAQIIILENDVPNLDYSAAHCIHFTKKEKDGRYGLIEGYRD